MARIAEGERQKEEEATEEGGGERVRARPTVRAHPERTPAVKVRETDPIKSPPPQTTLRFDA